MRMTGERSTGGWPRMSFPLDFDGGDGSALWVHRVVCMMGKGLRKGKWGGVGTRMSFSIGL